MSPDSPVHPKSAHRQPTEVRGILKGKPFQKPLGFPFSQAPNLETLPCSSSCVPYRPLSTIQPSLKTRIWSASTTVESLWATTMVVRLAQTLAREAWMALSFDVSSADVAYREDLGKPAPTTQNPSRRRIQAAS